MTATRFVLVIALAMATAPLAGCGGGGGSSGLISEAAAGPTLHAPSPVELQLADEVFDRIVQWRGKPLARDPASDELAHAHAADMVARKFENHTNPDGMTVKDRIEAAGLTWTRYGQVIDYGPGTSQEVLNGWIALEDQRVILDADFAGAGVGVVEIAPGSYAWVVLFRTP